VNDPKLRFPGGKVVRTDRTGPPGPFLRGRRPAGPRLASPTRWRGRRFQTNFFPQPHRPNPRARASRWWSARSGRPGATRPAGQQL